MLLDVILQQEVLEIIVVAGIAIVILGLFWRVIIIGIALLFSVIVLANHAPNNPTKEIVVTQTQIPIETVKVIVDPKRSEYISDCVSYGFEKSWCENNWDDKK